MIDKELEPLLPQEAEVLQIIIAEGPVKVEDAEPAEEIPFDANLAEYLDSSTLGSLASELIQDFDNDFSSIRDWRKTYIDGLDLLGLKIEERNEPWLGSCGVYHPILSEAAVRFQADVMTETFASHNLVKAKIVGEESVEKRETAVKIANSMNHILIHKMTEFRSEHERMLWNLALAGSAFKKIYYDPVKQRPVSMFVPAEDLIVSYGASDLASSPRITHIMRKTESELKKLQRIGFYRDIDLGKPPKIIDDIQERKDEDMGYSAQYDDRHRLLEMHVELDLKNFEHIDPITCEPTGIPLPYVVTLEKHTQTILSIKRNWDEQNPLKEPQQYFVHYTYVPGFGFYGYGLIHLVGGFAKSATSVLRQLVDAGTLSNLPGGLKTRGARIKGDDTPISPGEFRDVDVASGTLRENLIPLPYKEPSQTLFLLLQNIVEEGRRLAATAEVNFGAADANAPVGTTLAMLERTLKIITAVQARIHHAFGQELKLIAAIISKYGIDSDNTLDYNLVDIIPVSDPNAATTSQKIIQYQAAIQLAHQAPQVYNLPLLHRQMLEILGIKNAEKIVSIEEDAHPVDPITENQNILTGTPVKAFLHQDHASHLTAHMTFKQNPRVMQMLGQNPNAQSMMAALDAHLAEHLGFAYRRQIEKLLGVVLPDPEQSLPVDIEVALSKIVADASDALLQRDLAEAQAQQNIQQAMDPVTQMQQMELQLRQQEIDIRRQAEELRAQIARERLAMQERVAMLNSQTRQTVNADDNRTKIIVTDMDNETALRINDET